MLGDIKTILDRMAIKLNKHFRSKGRGEEHKFRLRWWKAKNNFRNLHGRLQQNKETLSSV